MALGIFSHAEERFVFVAVAVLLIAGSGGLAALARLLAPAARAAAFAAAVVALGLTYAFSVQSVDRQLAGVATSRAILVAVSDAVSTVAGPDCVLLTSSIPEITWYSGCAAYRHDSRVGRREVQEASNGFIVLFDNLKDDALRPHVEDLIREAGRPLFLPSIGGSVGDARIWSLPQ